MLKQHHDEHWVLKFLITEGQVIYFFVLNNCLFDFYEENQWQHYHHLSNEQNDTTIWLQKTECLWKAEELPLVSILLKPFLIIGLDLNIHY